MTPRPLPFLSTAARADAAGQSDAALAVIVASVSLCCVIAGFALVALGLIGITPGSFVWGAVLCVGGWASAAWERSTRARKGSQ